LPRRKSAFLVCPERGWTMRASPIPALIVVLTLAADPARADGLFYSLPKDGTWAKYQLDSTSKVGSYNIRAASIRMASVGRVTEQGEPCRWIEVVFERRFEGPKGSAEGVARKVWKVLVPEKYLVKGESPLDHAVRAWTAEGSGANKAEKPREMKNVKFFQEGLLPVILTGPLKDPKRLGEAVVESKLGKLPCEGVSGVAELEEPQEAFRFTLETRVHAEAPFGVVSSRWTTEEIPIEPPLPKGVKEAKPRPNRVAIPATELSWKLEDFGYDAKSELPDAK
jgi:hypothetical protein